MLPGIVETARGAHTTTYSQLASSALQNLRLDAALEIHTTLNFHTAPGFHTALRVHITLALHNSALGFHTALKGPPCWVYTPT